MDYFDRVREICQDALDRLGELKMNEPTVPPFLREIEQRAFFRFSLTLRECRAAEQKAAREAAKHSN